MTTQAMIMHSCRCLKPDVRGRLQADDHAPTLAVCGSCCSLSYQGGGSRNFACLSELPIEGVSPGQSLGQVVRRFIGNRMEIVGVPDAPSIRVLLLDGQPVGELFIIRRTADGPVLLFPGSSEPWYERVVHPDDIAVGFGIETEERPSRQRQVWQILCDSLQARALSFAPRILFRLA